MTQILCVPTLAFVLQLVAQAELPRLDNVLSSQSPRHNAIRHVSKDSLVFKLCSEARL